MKSHFIMRVWAELTVCSRGQMNRGYKNMNPDTDIHFLIFISYKRNRILEKGIRIGENRIKDFQY